MYNTNVEVLVVGNQKLIVAEHLMYFQSRNEGFYVVFYETGKLIHIFVLDCCVDVSCLLVITVYKARHFIILLSVLLIQFVITWFW